MHLKHLNQYKLRIHVFKVRRANAFLFTPGSQLHQYSSTYDYMHTIIRRSTDCVPGSNIQQ